jgi:hypothetical protein
MPREPRSSNDQDGPRMALVPTGAKEAQLMMLFETYGERYTARRLAAYVEDLQHIDLDTLAEAIRHWRRAQPAHRQAPSPAELVALAEAGQERRTPTTDAREEQARWARSRATPEEITAAYAEALAKTPAAPFLRWAVAQRQQRLEAGESGDGALEVGVILGGLQEVLADMPERRAREPGEEGA